MMWSDAERATFKRLWGEGTNIKVIARELGRPPSAIKAQRKHMNLPPRRRPMVEGAKRSVEVRVYLSPKVASRLGARSMQASQSMSSYIRTLIMRDLGL